MLCVIASILANIMISWLYLEIQDRFLLSETLLCTQEESVKQTFGFVLAWAAGWKL